MTGECVEWILDGEVIGKSQDVKIEFEKNPFKTIKYWSELTINGLVFGDIKNIEIIKTEDKDTPNQVRADFKPGLQFGDWMNDKRAMEFDSVTFLYNLKGDCEEVLFGRRE